MKKLLIHAIVGCVAFSAGFLVRGLPGSQHWTKGWRIATDARDSVSPGTGLAHTPPMLPWPVGSEVVDRIGPAEIQEILRQVAPDARGAIFRDSKDGRAQYILNIRRDQSEAEQHEAWDDVMIIQSGHGALDYSRSIHGGSRYSRGEWRGGALFPKPTILDLAPGIMVRVPAGVPHVIRPLGAAPLVYLVLKEKAGDEKAGESDGGSV